MAGGGIGVEVGVDTGNDIEGIGFGTDIGGKEVDVCDTGTSLVWQPFTNIGKTETTMIIIKRIEFFFIISISYSIKYPCLVSVNLTLPVMLFLWIYLTIAYSIGAIFPKEL